MTKKIYQIITVTVMGGVLYGLFIAGILTPQKQYSNSENRALATKPAFSWNGFIKGDFETEYEAYITDQFVGRDNWITAQAYLNLALGKREMNGVYFGRDNYLMETHKNSEIDGELAEKNAARLAEFLSVYQQKLGEDRVKAMLIPTAGQILADKLPPFADTFDQQGYLDSLKERGKTGVIDVTQTLTNHNEDYIFYRTDHHWTALGAYYAYTQWAEEMGFTAWKQEDFTQKIVSEKFLGTLYSKVNIKTKPDTITLFYPNTQQNYTVEYDLQTTEDTLYEMSHLDTKDKYAVYLDGNHSMVTIHSQNQNQRKLLLIKDSYAHCFAPFAANHYEDIVMIDLRYYRGSVRQLVEAEGITDILVLYNIPNYVADKNIGSLLK